MLPWPYNIKTTVLKLHPSVYLNLRCVAPRSTSPQRWFCVRATASRWTGGRWAWSCMSSWWAALRSSGTRQRSCSVRSSAVSHTQPVQHGVNKVWSLFQSQYFTVKCPSTQSVSFLQNKSTSTITSKMSLWF